MRPRARTLRRCDNVSLAGFFFSALGSRHVVSAIAAAQAEWDRVREEKVRGGGGGGKQDDDEDNGKFVSFVPLPTQAEIESAILAKRKAELLQVSYCAPRFCACLVTFARAAVRVQGAAGIAGHHGCSRRQQQTRQRVAINNV
jgi:hypothetical protein